MVNDSSGPSRRSFLGAVLTGTGAIVLAPSVLSGCGSDGGAGGGTGGGQVNSDRLADALPKYVPATGGPQPAIASVSGAQSAATDPVFLSYPTSPVRTVTTTPGKGGSYTAITPLWGSIPPAGNSYYRAVNQALGANLTIQPANGNTYNQTVPTLAAGDKLPDWIQLPAWWNGNINVGELAVRKFADLTEHLAGDKITKYPNLAAIPTGGWQAGAWRNRLYGIPSFTSQATFPSALYHRADILEAKGISPASVTSAESLYALGKELTSARNNVWAFDVLWFMIQQMYGVPPTGLTVTVVDGKVVSAYDTPQLAEALDFAYKLAKSGYVHPDALAGNTSNGKQRFYSGSVLIAADGPGAWNASDADQGRSSSRKYRRGAFPIFSADGTSTPTIPLGSSTSIVSYLNKNLSADRIEECLAIANYLAAPYGSAEYTLVNYGVEGVHWKRSASGPTYTTQGTKEANQSTYQFLCGPRSVVTNPGYEEVSRSLHAWSVDAVKHAVKPPFWNMNINTPSRFSRVSTGTQVNDIITQVTYGKKTVADVRTAAANWKAAGGQQLIDWFQKEVVDKFGTGQ